MNALRGHLQGAIRATERYSATRFWWFGTLSAEVAEHVRPILAARPEVARGHLVGSLAAVLYEDFYQRGSAQPSRSPYAGSPRANGWEPFVAELSEANCGTGTLQAGWEIIAVDGVELSIRRDGLTLRVQPNEVVYAGTQAPVVGDEVALKLPKELPALSPGFCTVLSDAPYRPEGRQVVRLYWNLYPWGAATLVRELTTRCNVARLPLRLKLINRPDRYHRCDAAVLYVIKDDLEAAVPLLREVYATVGDALKLPIPALTKRVAPGVGLAEDPPDGDSFGQQRCRLLADGIVRGWERGLTTVEERLAAVIERFAEAGIDIERPYLNPGSVGDYDFTLAPNTPPHKHHAGSGDADYLRLAGDIGGEICREAFWHAERCNWLGVQPRNTSAPAHHGMTYASLGPELYGGSSGVALFLAELAVATGDEVARCTALGAIRQALGRADAISAPVQLGLYTGRPGLALVARRVGTLLDADDVRAAAEALLAGLDADLAMPHEHDLLSGEAGGLLALLVLRQLLGDEGLLAAAVELGKRLDAAAQPDGAGCSWPSPASPQMLNLTGLSHGAAGIAMALLELWQATGDDRYRAVAEQGFAFERGWFNAEAGNWPDFRQVTRRAERPEGPFPYPVAWCHGAPGIALSRLRAWQLTGNAAYRDEAIAALDTTERSVRAALWDGTENNSLCHGLAGNAEILMLGADALGDGFGRYAAAAREVATAGIEHYAPVARSWPLGVNGGWTPSLMLGIAGIGRFYLRLAKPELVSSLLAPWQLNGLPGR